MHSNRLEAGSGAKGCSAKYRKPKLKPKPEGVKGHGCEYFWKDLYLLVINL